MQNRRGLIFLGLAVVMGLAAAWATSELAPTSAEATVVAAKTTPIVVVRSDVPVASSLTIAQLKLVDWPIEHVPTGALHSIADAKDRISRRPLAQGEPVIEAALYPTGSAGGLGAVIADQHRAVSVKVDNVIGVAGFVVPGSRVDVMATIRRVDRARAIPFSKVILQDVRVLAVDQKLEEVKSGEPELVNVVTLEVSPVQAEHLIYAAHEGRLQLALRSPGDDAKVATRSIGVSDLLDGRSSGKPAKKAVASAHSKIKIVRGTKVDVEKF
ncbi:MAG: Flp pilus assembly protein CpaB [Deltaproteobacteria bacterium]|jgi:pilus assembly protein CpaB|nr:Flp pilus assembly protein CpaB [Deltaproteobacteria bacterium]